jgi:hypothetical protein
MQTKYPLRRVFCYLHIRFIICLKYLLNAPQRFHDDKYFLDVLVIIDKLLFIKTCGNTVKQCNPREGVEMKKTALVLGGAIFLAATSMSSAQVSAEVGVLSCDVSAGIGLIIEQKQKVSCTLSNGSGQPQQYQGSIDQYGLELGEVSGGHMTWTVLAATSTVDAGALAGTYAGAEADASLGLGAGIQVLVGGTGKAFTLQPLAVDTEKGTALSAGVETLTLEYVKP